MANSCPTCSQDIPAVKCAKCGTVVDNERLNEHLEPIGWREVADPRGPLETKGPDGKPVKLPRHVLVCEDCFRAG